MSSQSLSTLASSIFTTNALKTSTTTDDEFNNEYETQYYLSLIVPVLFGFIVLVGFTGNVMVIGSVLLNRQMRSTTNLLIIHLALADILFIIFCVPFTAVSYAITIWPFGDVWCKIYHYMNMVTAITSVYTLVLMSLDRYLAVCHPIRSIDMRSPTNTLLAIWIVTGIIVVSLLPLISNFACFQFAEGVYRCVNVKIKDDPVNHKIFQACFFAFGFALPLGLVCLLYGLMLRRLLYGGMRNRRVTEKNNQNNKKRITRLVVVVVTTFALCWLPIHIIFLIQAGNRRNLNDGNDDEEESDELVSLQIIAQCLAYLNSCMNPILYAFLSEQFRKSFLSLFARCRSNKQNNRFHEIRQLPTKPTNKEATPKEEVKLLEQNKPLNNTTENTSKEDRLVENKLVPE